MSGPLVMSLALMLVVCPLPAQAGPVVPAELLPRVSLKLGITGDVRVTGRATRPWALLELEWRLGPMARAWAHQRAPLDPSLPPALGVAGELENDE